MKKKNSHGCFRHKWPWILLLQIILTMAAFALLSLSLWLGGFLHSLCLWLLTPLAGFASACIATRRGLLNYLSWLIPPLAQVAMHLLLWGYPPAVAPVFLCGFISLVGAATGEVLKAHNKQNKGVSPWKKI